MKCLFRNQIIAIFGFSLKKLFYKEKNADRFISNVHLKQTIDDLSPKISGGTFL